MPESFVQQNADIIFGRINPGEELFAGVYRICREHGVTSGAVVSCIGSFTKTTYTYVANVETSPVGVGYLETLVLERPVEVLCAQGTIGINKDTDKLDMHMHALLIDTDARLTGGHLLEGCIVCATIEIAIAAARDGSIVRGLDDALQVPVFRYHNNKA